MPEQASPFKIIVVGGGIGGLCAAIALRRADRHITILEQSSLNREIGATISLQPNASKIVEQTWGMSKILSSIGMIDEGFRIYGTDGVLQKTIPLSTSKYGADRVVYHRQDLHSALKAHALDAELGNVEIRVSSRVVDCDIDVGDVILADGTRLSADLIIGADGIKSTIREAVTGLKMSAQPTGLAAYRLMADTTVLEAEEPGFCRILNPRTSMTTMVMAHDRRLIMGPARDGKVFSIVALVPDHKTAEDTGNSWTSSATLKEIMQEFESFPSWTKAPFKHSQDIGLWQLRDNDPLETWQKGRAVLIGDAAHAMLPTQGQGASQAVEDAEALGYVFADIDSQSCAKDVSTRLQTFFEARHERASLIQGYSRMSAKPATAKGDIMIKM